MSTGLRERKKLQIREQLVDVAWTLFEEHGFDQVTVDQIADAASLSPRTFFRYFGSKEAVLFADQEGLISLLRAAIAMQPEASSPIAMLRAAVKVLAADAAANRKRHMQRARMLQFAAVTRYEQTVLRPQWEAAMAESLAARLGVEVDVDLRPRLFAGIGLAVMSAVGLAWMTSNGKAKIDALVDDAFAALASEESA